MKEIAERTESHIFISYSRKDRKIADWIARQLTAGGYEIWIDRRDIPGGSDWAEMLAAAIGKTDGSRSSFGAAGRRALWT